MLHHTGVLGITEARYEEPPGGPQRQNPVPSRTASAGVESPATDSFPAGEVQTMRESKPAEGKYLTDLSNSPDYYISWLSPYFPGAS